jgi:hypothetical protein
MKQNVGNSINYVVANHLKDHKMWFDFRNLKLNYMMNSSLTFIVFQHC